MDFIGGDYMELRITVYKNSGKFYTDEVVKNDKDIYLWKEEFKDFIRANIPARVSGGYVVVEDLNDNQSFHNVLYKYDELMGRGQLTLIMHTMKCLA